MYEKISIGVKEIKARYGVGTQTAYKIIREIRNYNGGGVLPKGLVLPFELEKWEHKNEKKEDAK